jgi:hypothetical protein
VAVLVNSSDSYTLLGTLPSLPPCTRSSHRGAYLLLTMIRGGFWPPFSATSQQSSFSALLCDEVILLQISTFSKWAMLGSNQRPLPCEGSKIVC